MYVFSFWCTKKTCDQNLPRQQFLATLTLHDQDPAKLPMMNDGIKRSLHNLNEIKQIIRCKSSVGSLKPPLHSPPPPSQIKHEFLEVTTEYHSAPYNWEVHMTTCTVHQALAVKACSTKEPLAVCAVYFQIERCSQSCGPFARQNTWMSKGLQILQRFRGCKSVAANIVSSNKRHREAQWNVLCQIMQLLDHALDLFAEMLRQASP